MFYYLFQVAIGQPIFLHPVGSVLNWPPGSGSVIMNNTSVECSLSQDNNKAHHSSKNVIIHLFMKYFTVRSLLC